MGEGVVFFVVVGGIVVMMMMMMMSVLVVLELVEGNRWRGFGTPGGGAGGGRQKGLVLVMKETKKRS